MRKNVRRSLVLLAAASGAWALGAATASASELPLGSGDHVVNDTVSTVSHTLGSTQKTVRTTTRHTRGVTGKVTGTAGEVTGTAGKAARGATSKLPAVSPLTSTVHRTVRGLTEGLADKGVLGTVTGAAGEATGGGAASGTVETVDHTVRSTVRRLPAGATADKVVGKATGTVSGLADSAALPTSALPTGVLPTEGLPTEGLPAEGLPTDALSDANLPALPQVPGVPSTPGTGDLLSGIAAAGLRPEQLAELLRGGVTQPLVGTATKTLTVAQPAVEAGTAVLPPAGREVAGRVVPVAAQAALDAGDTVDDAVAETAFFADEASLSAGCLVGNAAADVQDAVGQVPGAGAGSDLPYLAGDAALFASDVATNALPFAHTVGDVAFVDAHTLAADAVSGLAGDVALPLPAAGDLGDAANLPSLPVVSSLPVNPAV